MDEIRNPYAPGAGTPPQELAGRGDVLEAARTALHRIAAGRPCQSPVLVGLRGVGKTVLLVRIQEMAESEGFLVVAIEGCEERGLAAQLAPGLRKALLSLNQVEAAVAAVRRAVGVFKAFLGGLGVTVGDMTLTYDPSIGVADSGNIEADLPDLFEELGRVAAAAERLVVIFVDELQVLEPEEFSALIMAVHRVNQKRLPIAFVGAGLPQVLALAGNAKSYAERLFRYPEIGALKEEDAVDAIVNPAQAEGVSFEADAVSEILRVTQRYPYFLQQWAHDAWNIADGEIITWRNVLDATDISTAELDRSFFKVRLDRCTQAERNYMRALAELGEGPRRSSDVADVLGSRPDSINGLRSSLIKKGMIYAPSHGDICFTVPLFDSFMRRAMPQVERRPA